MQPLGKGCLINLSRNFIKEIFKQQLNCKKTNGEKMKRHLDKAPNNSVVDRLEAVEEVVEHSSLLKFIIVCNISNKHLLNAYLESLWND
jgi:hypothetical protein